ncbi:hypothetical protein GCM10017710_41250 [Arthrobacter ramosus]
MEGRATPTMETSRPSRARTVHTTISSSHWARVQRTAVWSCSADLVRVLGEVMEINLYDTSFNDKEYDPESYDVDFILGFD